MFAVGTMLVFAPFGVPSLMAEEQAQPTDFQLLTPLTNWATKLPPPAITPQTPAFVFELLPINHHVGPWTGVRECESSHDYGAINPRDTDGTPSYGAYQFKQTTWDWVVEYGQRPELIGVRPDKALRTQQDWAAEQLRIMPGGGLGHWPYCGQFYG